MADGGERGPGTGSASLNTNQNLTEWAPSLAERKLLYVLLDPANRLKSVTDICQLAGIARPTYYVAFDKPEFVDHYRAQSLEMVKRHAGPVLSAFLREAQRGSYTHGLVILEMAGLYTSRSRVEHTGANGGPIETREILSQDEVQSRLRAMGLLPAAPEPAADTETPH